MKNPLIEGSWRVIVLREENENKNKMQNKIKIEWKKMRKKEKENGEMWDGLKGRMRRGRIVASW